MAQPDSWPIMFMKTYGQGFTANLIGMAVTAGLISAAVDLGFWTVVMWLVGYGVFRLLLYELFAALLFRLRLKANIERLANELFEHRTPRPAFLGQELDDYLQEVSKYQEFDAGTRVKAAYDLGTADQIHLVGAWRYRRLNKVFQEAMPKYLRHVELTNIEIKGRPPVSW